MSMMRRTALAVLLSLILFLASAAPVWAAGDFWFAKLKYDGSEVSGEILSEAELTDDVGFLWYGEQSIGTVSKAGNPQLVNGLYVQPFTGVTNMVYDPLHIDWDGEFSAPISPEMDFSGADMVYYVEGEQLALEQVHILIHLPGTDHYFRYPNFSEALRIDVSQPGFVEIRRLTDEIQYLLGMSPEDVDVVIMIETLDRIYIDQSYDPQFSGRIIPLTNDSIGSIEIQLPEEQDWDIHTEIFIPKDASGRPITMIPMSPGRSISAKYVYDIGVAGTGTNPTDAFLLMKENVLLQAGDPTTISFAMDDLELVTWEFDWTVDESSEFREEDFLLQGIGVGMQGVIPAIVTDPQEDQMERLYVAGGLHSDLYFRYCLIMHQWLEECYEYQVHMPVSGETVQMDTDFRSSMQLTSAWTPVVNVTDGSTVFLFDMEHLQVEDGAGNQVSIVFPCEFECEEYRSPLEPIPQYLDLTLEQEGGLWIQDQIDYLPVTERYASEVWSIPVFGLYRATVNWDNWAMLPLTAEPTYVYVHNDLQQLVHTVWPDLEDPESVHDIVSMLRDQPARFDGDEVIRKTQIRLLMSLIESGRLHNSSEFPNIPIETFLHLSGF